MEDLPAELPDRDLRAGLAQFGITGPPVYAPVGFGDYHWTVYDRWFTSVSDLTTKPLAGLRQAMETAASLAEQLPFVVAPVRSDDGETVVVLNDRYALSVFPYVMGKAGTFGDPVHPGVTELLTALHRCEPPAGTPVAPMDIPGRAALTALLDEPGEWFSAEAREVFVAHTEIVHAALTELDLLAGQLPDERVVTHGEPHAGNVIRSPQGLCLIDWDTVGLAPPERDHWLAGGYSAFYSLRWAVGDIADFTRKLRAPHEQSRDAELTLHYFTETLKSL
ncbi:aminoglycoside phosphotransferase family protein [Lentzea californiensis]|uniref:aminoglycoside phosphotransferase family protein n=1 Tax=Lentzea californiensis TaxID=438851 RepID=UPI0021657F58|nr:aminoglycoside phosphotransferase family protein [Lentzea californiensis]MCR3749154.1 spectinomycin phosphotransferase [Lentzea californiensis]